MFTGLVERTGRVIEISSQLTGHNLFKLTIDPGPDFARTQGASVAVNGVCLSEVEDNVEGLLHFHVSPETLSKTSLDQVRVGQFVNLERAMRPSDRFGGHIVLGHVDGTGRVVDLQKVEDFWLLKVEVSFDLSRYIVSKGSITIDGVSLTVNAIEDQPTSSIISFMLIPITWETTALHQVTIGSKVNVEVDILAKHLERFATRAKDQMSRLITPLALMFMIILGFFSQNVYAIGWTDIRLALIKNNVSLQKSSVSNMRLMEEVKKQESGFYPSVDAFLEKSKSIEPRATSSESNRIGLRLNQNLFAGFRDKYSAESTSLKQQANQFQGKYDSAKLRYELKNLFDASLFYQKAIVFAEKTVARRAENLRIVNLRYEGGRENRSSVLKTEASLLMAEVDLKDYVSSLELTKSNMAKLTGLMVSDLNKIEGSLANRQDPSQFSLQNHPLVQQSNFMKQSTGVDVGIARSQWLPKVDAAADFYRRGVDQKIDSQNYLSVSLNLSVPLFEPAQSHNYKIAVFSATDAELNAAKVENDIEIELRTSEFEFQSAQLSLTAAAKSLEASKLQAEVYRQRYTLGMISFQDWDAAETDFIKSEKDLLGAEHQLSKSISKVNLARGLTIEES